MYNATSSTFTLSPICDASAGILRMCSLACLPQHFGVPVNRRRGRRQRQRLSALDAQRSSWHTHFLIGFPQRGAVICVLASVAWSFLCLCVFVTERITCGRSATKKKPERKNPYNICDIVHTLWCTEPTATSSSDGTNRVVPCIIMLHIEERIPCHQRV